MLEASAGTGKTYALAALVTRYVAEGRALLDDMLLITFSRAASQELRERVRDQLVARGRGARRPGRGRRRAARATWSPGADEELAERRRHLRDALAGFDAATIATTHQFCQLVLRSLGVAGDTDAGVTLVENLDELVGEIVDDLYLQRFGDVKDTPELTRAQAARARARGGRATRAPGSPRSTRPPRPRPACAARSPTTCSASSSGASGCSASSASTTCSSRLAVALEADDAPARDRMSRRWSIVMVDEFQDTDPVQWEVIERAFVGRVTLVLIGDPKQAIYAFRGGDVVTYLRARERADALLTLDTNYRSDAAAGAAAAPRSSAAPRSATTTSWSATVDAPTGSRTGWPARRPTTRSGCGWSRRDAFGIRGTGTIPMDDLRPYIAADLAADVKALLASDATYDGRPVRARDVAVIVESHRDARACRDALAAAGVPAVYTGDTDVFASQAAADWQCLLEAFEQPGRAGLVRAAATTMFFGRTAAELRRRTPTSPTRSPRRCAAGPTTPGPAASRPSSRRRTSPAWPSGCWPGAAASGTSPTWSTSPSCCTRSPTATAWACPRCCSGCAPSARSGPARPSATAASTATPPPCRS